MYLTYEEFVIKLDKIVKLDQEFYVELLRKIIKSPYRYIGPFRASNLKTKLIQNVTQSREIKFGDFMEEIVTQYLSKLGFNTLNKNLGLNENGKALLTDQLFEDDKNVYLVEQKIRDDHDSTKKDGQTGNFVKKIDRIRALYPNKHLIASMWFIDPNFYKCRYHYQTQINTINRSDTEVHLYYGGELFSDLIRAPQVWDEITAYLQRNKTERSQQVITIADMDTSNEIYEALLRLEKKYQKNLLSSDPQYVELRNELFPTSFNLNKLKQSQLQPNQV